MKKAFFNSDLRNDVEKHKRADEVDISKSENFLGEEKDWFIDVNDSGYIYSNEQERDSDYELITDLFPNFINMGLL